MALHLNRSSLHAMHQQQSFDTAVAWVGIDDTVEECVETFAEPHEYREQIKRARRKAMKAVSRARTPSRGKEVIVPLPYR